MHTNLVSIAEGCLDTTIPPELTSVATVVPQTNGFSVYSSSIPHVWSSIDHQAIVWCGQFRISLTSALIGSLNQDTVDKRLAVFKNYLLPVAVDNGDDQQQFKGWLRNYKVRRFSLHKNKEFSVLTDTRPVANHEDGLKVFVCDSAYAADKRLESCRNLAASHVQRVPKASSNSALASPSEVDSLYYINYHAGESGEVLVVTEPPGFKKSAVKSMIVAEPTTTPLVLKEGLLRLTLGKTIKLKRQVMSRVVLDSIWSSLVSLQVRVGTRDSNHARFQPIVRQYVDEPNESKYFLNVGDEFLSIKMHAIAPYVPFKDGNAHKLNLQVLSDEDVEMWVKIDWFSSIGRLFLHYRSALAVFPLTVVMAVLMIQWAEFNKRDNFLTFHDALVRFVHGYMGYMMGLAAVLPVILANGSVQSILQFIEPALQDEERLSNHVFLGLEGSHMWILGPIFIAMATALCIIQCYIVDFVTDSMKQCTPTVLLPLLQALVKSGTVVLIALSCCVPFQVVVVGACGLQLLNVLHERWNTPLERLNTSLFILLLWVLPISIPVALVWMRNPEPEFHGINILSVLPSLLLLNQLPTALALPKSNVQLWVTHAMLGYIMLYALIFGIQRSYWLHHLVNFLYGWFLLMLCLE